MDFALLVELKSHKDASVETIMNLLCLESPLVDAPGMNDLQLDEDQPMVPIHRSEDQAVLGSTSLSFALSVYYDRVERIRKNIAEHRTFDVLPTVVATTTALSTTFASMSTVSSVSVDDYIIGDAGNEENVQLNVEEENQGKGKGSAVSMVEVEFKKEECSMFMGVACRHDLLAYKPLFPSASITSYGPSHLGPNFPVESGFKRAFATLFGQDIRRFFPWPTMFLNVDQLEKQLDKDEFQEIGPMAPFKVRETQFQMFIKSQMYMDDEYTTEDKVDSRKALDASLVDTKSSGTTLKEQDTSSRSGMLHM
ncbi:hypothetical protein Tco_1568744 [Tanacetum coccineum]